MKNKRKIYFKYFLGTPPMRGNSFKKKFPFFRMEIFFKEGIALVIL